MSEIDTLSKFGEIFQNKAISAMLTDRSFLDQAQDIILPKHFELDAHQWIVRHILSYFSSYKNIPSMEVFKQELEKDSYVSKDEIVSALREVYKHLNDSDLKYIKDEYLEFCKNTSLKQALLTGADLLKTGQYDEIRTIVDKALHAGIERNFGHDWKTDIELRLIQKPRKTLSTGWPIIDQITDGGLAAGELGVVVAPPGVGKSWALAHLGKVSLFNGYNVIHFTLELNENYLGIRYDTLCTGYEPSKMKNHIDEVRQVIDKAAGQVKIKYYPSRSITVNTLRAYLERIQGIGFKPDLILVDYADLMRSSDKANARHEELGYIYEELRSLGGEWEVPIWTASQSQRSSINEDVISGDRIADSIGKLMVGDFLISISRKLEDKIGGTARIHVMKNRFGMDGMTYPAKVDFLKGIFDIYDSDSSQGVKIQQSMMNSEEKMKKYLHERYNNHKSKLDSMLEEFD